MACLFGLVIYILSFKKKCSEIYLVCVIFVAYHNLWSIMLLEWPRSEAFLGRDKNQKKSMKPFCRKFYGDYFFEIFDKKILNCWRFLIGRKKSCSKVLFDPGNGIAGLSYTRKSTFLFSNWKRVVKVCNEIFFFSFTS